MDLILNFKIFFVKMGWNFVAFQKNQLGSVVLWQSSLALGGRVRPVPLSALATRTVSGKQLQNKQKKWGCGLGGFGV